MKTVYSLVILGLVIVWVIFVVWKYCVADCSTAAGTLDAAVEALSALAAAAAAVIALGLADPPKREISIEQVGATYLQTDKREPKKGHPDEHPTSGMPEDYPERPCYPNDTPCHSYRVGFDLRNMSGFNIRRARMTVEFPVERTAPRKCMRGQQAIWEPSCNAWFEVTLGLPERLVVEDRFLLMAVLAQNWPPGAVRKFWARLVLDTLPEKPFAVNISVESDDTEGGTCKVTVDPRALLKTAEQPR